MSERLVIEIDGNASGLTKALADADKRLNNFNSHVANGSKALTGFVRNLNSVGNSVNRLNAATGQLRTTLNTLNRSFVTVDKSLTKFGNQARSSANDLRAFSTQLTGAGRRLDGLGANARGAGNQLTSLNRRAAALGNTISALNTALRGLTRTAGSAGSAMGAAGAGAGRAAAGVTAAGNAANRASGAFARLNRHNEQLLEGFRRNVAQLTAFRTLAYQGLFWFSPLIYSIIKVNAAYEKQMVLLKNIAKATTDAGKAREAVRTRNTLLGMAETNPFSLEQITDSFVKMRVGGVEPLNGSLQTLMDSIAAFGGDNNALQRASVAIQQMGGKGVVSMEELRQQLGEHIPDAATAMAEGMGMSVAKLFKQIEKGNVEATTALGKMFAVLDLRHENSAEKMMQTWAGLMARLGTAWQKFIVRVTESQGANSFIETLKRNIQELIQWLNTPAGTNFAIEVQQVMAKLVDGFVTLIKYAYQYRDTIVMLAKAFTLYFGGRLVIGVILGIARAWMILQGTVVTAGRAMIGVLSLITGRTTAAAAASRVFGASTMASARAMGIFNTAGALSIRNLALLAVRFVAAAGAAALLVGAIWAVVTALNAKNAAESKSQQLKREAIEGGVWESESERKGQYGRLKAISQKLRDNYEYVYDPETKMTIKKPLSEARRNQLRQEEITGYQGYIQKTQNTQRLASGNREQTYRSNYEAGYKDTINKIGLDYETRSIGLDEKAQIALDKELTQRKVDAAKQDIARLQTALKNAKSSDERNAILSLLDERRGTYEGGELVKPGDLQKYEGNLGMLNADNKFIDAGGEGGKKKDGKSREQSKLESLQDKFANSAVRTAELEHELENLKNGTDGEFNNELAHEKAMQEARNKTIEQLEIMIRTEERRREELKKTIAVEKAIVELNVANEEALFEYEKGVESLLLGYESLTNESDNYRKTLERQYRSEIITAKARVESGKPTEEEIRQYKELTRAINDAVRAKELEMILNYSKEADAYNRNYKRDRMTTPERVAYDFDLEQKKLDDVMNAALNDRDKSLSVAAKYEEELGDIRARLAEERTQQLEEEEIKVIGLRDKERERAATAQALIPILQERQRILDEERKLAEAGPIAQWADNAARGLDDIKTGFQNLVAEGLDGLINGLMEGKMAFGDFVKGVLKGLIQIIMKGLIAKAILSALGLPGGSMPSFNLGNLFGGGSATPGGHGGMIAGGTARFHRTVDPANFAFAKRYHTGGIVGLGQNEVPIIAERGEGVFTEEQMKALGQSSKGSNVQVNVINQTGTEATIERSPPRFDGEKWVEEIVLKKLSRPGPLRDAVGSLGKR